MLTKTKLGIVCDIQLGATPPRKTPRYWDPEKETNNIWLSIADLPNSVGESIRVSKEHLSDEGASRVEIVKQGTLLLSFKLSIGRVAFAGADLRTNEAIAALTIREEQKLDKKYLAWLLSSYNWDEIAARDEKVKGKTLNKAKLKEIAVAFPPIEKQKRIVAIMDEAFAGIDRAIANTEKNIANAEGLFESKLYKIFLQKGKDWRDNTLAEIALDFGRGKSKHRPRNDPDLYDGEYPFIQTGDVRYSSHFIETYSQTYNERGLAQSKLWPAGTLCITIAANIAETGILTFDACFPDSIIGLVVDDKKYSIDFIEYCLQFTKVKLQAAAKGSAQDNINLGTFEKWLFSFPPKHEQMQVVEHLQSIYAEISNLLELNEKKLLMFSELKRSLLQKAFSGELTSNMREVA